MPKARPAQNNAPCPPCGAINPGDARFCIRCGNPLHAIETPATSPSSGLISTPGVLTPAPGQQALVIGRDPKLAREGHVFLNHPAVSKRHARIEQRGRQWTIVDLDSKKGTFVNFSRVPAGPSGVAISENDVIWIAPYAFRFRTRGQERSLEPAHMRLDAVELVRRVPTKQGELTILDTRGVPLTFRPGEFIALVGGSGTGKTTLMRAINGLNPAQDGRVLIDGQPIIEQGNARRFGALYSIMGYVPQDDIMHRALTVNEVLTYTARLRLAGLSRAELKRAIEHTLTIVELSEHANKRIDQLSGGQRKRVNIAMELIAQPRVLFLDEPTSGLDPGLDLEMMSLLKRWSKGESASTNDERHLDEGDPKTIILVTHATENIELCDYITFMAPGGRIAYFGPPVEAKSFFHPHRNPDDVTYSQLYRTVAHPPDAHDRSYWPDQYLQSDAYRRHILSRKLAAPSPISDADALAPETSSKQRFNKGRIRNEAGQWLHLSSRYGRLITRDRLNAAFLVIQAPLTALLLGAVSSANALQPIGATDAEKVLFILAAAATWLGIINATKEIVKEQDIYRRERLYGLSAWPYVLSKVTVLGLIALLQSLLLVAFVAWQFNLPDAGVFLPLPVEMVITLFLSMMAGLALGLLISAYAKTSDLATTLMFLALILQIIFSGLLFEAKGLARLPSWLTSSRWGLEALGASADLNSLLVSAIPGYDWDPGYANSALNLGLHWFVLILFAIVLTSLTVFKQARK